MFYSVKGTLKHIDPGYIVVETGGIGFKLITTLSTISKIGQLGKEVELFTYLHVREGVMDLYGFFDFVEKTCFKMLISISGVGPKAGIAVLSAMTPETFAIAVAENNPKVIQQAPGIGPKISQRIILELKDKVKKANFASEGALKSASAKGMGNISEAVNALMTLGYNHGEATAALSGVDTGLRVEELIKIGLKQLAN